MQDTKEAQDKMEIGLDSISYYVSFTVTVTCICLISQYFNTLEHLKFSVLLGTIAL